MGMITNAMRGRPNGHAPGLPQGLSTAVIPPIWAEASQLSSISLMLFHWGSRPFQARR